MMQEIERKRVSLPEFRRKVVFSWYQYKKKYGAAPGEKNFIRFFREKFPEFFSYFMSRLFPFDASRLECVKISNVVQEEILFEYRYSLDPLEMADIRQFRQKYGHEESEEKIISYMFDSFTTIFGLLLHRFIDADVFISQACGIVRGSPPIQFLQFLISVRRNRRVVLKAYTASELFRFSDNFPTIPPSRKREMSEFRTNLHQIALQEYNGAEQTLAGVIYNFYRRCETLQFVSPILDFFTYVGSRTEDSNYSFSSILEQEFLPKFPFIKEKKAAILRLILFLQKVSTLFTTFQSSNKPEPKNQVELFLLYCQYFFQQGITILRESKEIIFFPELFNRNYSEGLRSGIISENASSRLTQFIQLLYTIVQSPGSYRFVELIFRNSLISMNEDFFEAYAKEINSQFFSLITNENIKLRDVGEKISFDVLMDLICRFSFVLIKKLFLYKKPEDAMVNFSETHSRYTAPRITMNVLDTILFREIPFTDTLWGTYLLSLQKDNVKDFFSREFNIVLPDTLFFTEKRLIHTEMIYAKGFTEQTSSLSEWLVNAILVPFSLFEKALGVPFQLDGSQEALSRIQKYFTDNARDQEEKGAFLEILEILQNGWPSIHT